MINSEIDTYEEKIKKITALSSWLWAYKVKEKNISQWLDNFEDMTDKSVALDLLSQFIFFDINEVRQGLKSIFNELYLQEVIYEYRENRNEISIAECTLFIKEELKKTRFVSVGNPSESSCLMLYLFRQENNLNVANFSTVYEVLERKEEVSRLIFIDDLLGSGSQASRLLKNTISKIRCKSANSIHISYFSLFASSDGINTLRTLKDVKERDYIFDRVQSVFELDNTYKVFNDESRYLTNSEQRNNFKEKCTTIFHDLCNAEDIKKGECGFGDLQLILGFFYNIPNNTLPIFWAQADSWTPIFKRYVKNYRFGF